MTRDPDTIWALWEQREGRIHRTLMGVYSNKEAADADAATNPDWKVEPMALDHEPVASKAAF